MTEDIESLFLKNCFKMNQIYICKCNIITDTNVQKQLNILIRINNNYIYRQTYLLGG